MEKSSVDFTTIGGNTVTYTFSNGEWICNGCGVGASGNRGQANDHAAKCRAV